MKIELCDHEGTALWVYDATLDLSPGDQLELRLPDELAPLMARVRVLRIVPVESSRPYYPAPTVEILPSD